jgi:hypothetical protein
MNLVLGLVLAAAAAMPPAPPAELVPGDHPDFPKLRWTEGGLSPNDRCPNRRVKLNPKIAPVWVNGRPIGFC